MKQIIQSHNRKLLRTDSTVDDCKCLKKNKHKCPLPGKCNTENVIYKATVTSDNCVKTYIGSTGQSWTIQDNNKTLINGVNYKFLPETNLRQT